MLKWAGLGAQRSGQESVLALRFLSEILVSVGLWALERRVTIYLPAEENPEGCQGLGTATRRKS